MYVHTSSVMHHSIIDQERQCHLNLYNRAIGRGRRGWLWSCLLGRSRRLLDLKEIETRCRVNDRSATGLRTVPIEQIRGSEGRTNDFDRDFNPLKNHTQERWLGIAKARQRGRVLPPVSLVQLGDLYFVLDGHHRISVARALGQQQIEARVTVWQVEDSLPWERPAPASQLALQPA
jgi:hypothetical protein